MAENPKRQALPATPGMRRRASKDRPAVDQLDLVLPPGWPETAGPVEWHWQPRQGPAQHGMTDDLRTLPDAARRVAARVWTPASDTLLASVRLPTRSHRKIRQALPFALEDRLVGDPESLRFAYRHEPDGMLSVAVTAHTRLHSWSEALKRAGIQPTALCPVTLFVPSAFDCWSLAFRDGEVLVRTGDVAGFVCAVPGTNPPPLLIAALQEATRQNQAPERLLALDPPPGFAAEAWSKTLGIPVRVEPSGLWGALHERAAPLNLLQDEPGQQSRSLAPLRPLLPAAALLLLWLAGNMIADITDWWTLHRQHEEQQRTMTSILLTSFPETRTVLDPAAQMKRALESVQLRRGQGDRDLLGQISKAAAVLRTDPRIRLRGIRYADHSLTLELTWPADGSTDALRKAFENAGLRSEVLSATPRAGNVDGRIRLQQTTAGPNR